jgi:hypothetical protein
MRQTFLHLSDTWIRLAAELESAQAFLNAVNGLEIKTPIAGDPSLPGDADSPPSEWAKAARPKPTPYTIQPRLGLTSMTNDDSAPNKPLPAVKGAHFSGLISEVGPGEWRAFAWVRKPDETPEQTIGPQTLTSVPLAREWLSLAAASHGFENFDIVVERLTDEDLAPEDEA